MDKKSEYLDIHKIPIYQRSNLKDLSVLNTSIIVYHDKNRDTVEELFDELVNIIQYKQYKKYEELPIKIWRFIDRYIIESQTNSELDDLETYLQFLNTLNPKLSKLINNAFINYRPRNIKYSEKYINSAILDYIIKRLEFSKEEKKLIAWAEYNIPNITRKIVAAILNENQFISLGYLLPINAVYTDSEKQKLYKFRRILLEKFKISQINKFNFSNHKSPILYYTEKTYKIIYNILPILGEEMKIIKNEIKKISNKIAQIKTKNIENVIMLRNLIKTRKNAFQYHDILNSQKQINNITLYNTSSVDQLLDLYLSRLKQKRLNMEYQEFIVYDLNCT